MAYKPKQYEQLNATSVDIINGVRNDMGEYYQSVIPMAENTTESIRKIGDILYTYTPLWNSFLPNIIDRISRTIITSKLYYNDLAGVKKGIMEFGETAQELFVEIAKGKTFNPERAETDFMKREIPDVRSAYHSINYRKFYKQTISNDELRAAFLSWNGITDLIARIVDGMYSAHNYDEFLVTKYMLARNILNGFIYPVNIPDVNKANSEDIVTEIAGVSNDLKYMKTKYNNAGVHTFTKKEDQLLITTGRFDALINVNVLANAFNLDYVQFMGNRIQIDSFANLDEERLAELFKDDVSGSYVPLTEEEKAMLEAVPAVLVDRDFFMIFDNQYQFTEDYNGEGLYWQYWLHAWKIFSTSPFSNAVIFTTATPAVTSVTVSPSTATVNKGNMLQLNAVVEGTGFISKAVTWSIDSDISTISSTGLLKVSANETAAEITVTVTSTYDASKTGTATITVPA